jgi:carbon monoxide dehydrogenase subunit G
VKDYVVKKKITLNAEQAAIWDALTNPKKTKEYFSTAA